MFFLIHLLLLRCIIEYTWTRKHLCCIWQKLNIWIWIPIRFIFMTQIDLNLLRLVQKFLSIWLQIHIGNLVLIKLSLVLDWQVLSILLRIDFLRSSFSRRRDLLKVFSRHFWLGCFKKVLSYKIIIPLFN